MEGGERREERGECPDTKEGERDRRNLRQPANIVLATLYLLQTLELSIQHKEMETGQLLFSLENEYNYTIQM